MDVLPAGLANGVGVVTLTVLVFWMLATGKLGTGRELREKDARIKALEAALETRDKQLHAVLTEYLPAANSVMQALHKAAEES